MIKNINWPAVLHPGEEKLVKAFTIEPHDFPIRISYIWADDVVKVLGVQMTNDNIVEIFPNNQKEDIYLKFACKKDTNIECEKKILIKIEKIEFNKYKVYSMWALSGLLILSSFIPLFFSNSSNLFSLQLTIGKLLKFNLPIITLLSIIIFSKKITVIIQRLSSINIESTFEYLGTSARNYDDIFSKSLQVKIKE